MTPDQINRIIHNKVMGKCWHEDDGLTARLVCKKCGLSTIKPECFRNPDYSKWEHYGPMLEVAMTKEWWGWFLNTTRVDTTNCTALIGLINQILLNPTRGRDAIAEFLKEKV